MADVNESHLWHSQNSADVILLELYVDDLLVAVSSPEIATRFFEFLKSKFEIRYTNKLSEFLSIIIEQNQDAGITKIHQSD